MMSKVLKKKHILAMTLAAAGLWMAADANATVNGFYLGGQGGYGNVHQDVNSGTTNVVVDLNGTHYTSTAGNANAGGLAGRAFAGYQFTPNIAVEAGYTRFHTISSNYNFNVTDTIDGDINQSVNKLTLTTQAFDVTAKAIYPFQNGFNVFGKLGAAYLRQAAEVKGTQYIDGTAVAAYKFTGSEGKVLPTFGLGAGYDISENLVADVSWNRIQTVGNTSMKSTDFFGVGLSYHFG